MYPIQIRIENFLSYRDSGKIDLNDKTIIVGENNAGKSNFVEALREFFRFSNRARQDIENFHGRDGDKQIRITVWFDGMTEEEADDFKQGRGEPDDAEYAVRLVSEYNDREKRAETNKYQQLVDGENRVWSDATGLANSLDSHLPDVSYYGADRSLEDAAKTSNKNSLLFKLLGSVYEDLPEEDRTELETNRDELKQELEDDTPEPIEKLIENLDDKLDKQVSIDGELDIEFDIPSVKEMVQQHATVWTSQDRVDRINDLGSGSQMSFILSCIWEVANRETGDVFLALEEPENYLHPHSIRELHTTLEELTGENNFIVLTTHSPELASPRDLRDVRRVTRYNGASEIKQPGDELSTEDVEKLRTIEAPETSEMFFSRSLIICEGASDRDVLRIANQLLADGNRDMSTFDAEGVSVINANGKRNVSVYLRVANHFGIPTLALLDTDEPREEYDEDTYIDWETIRECRKLSDRFVMLEGDLERALFEETGVEAFHNTMERLSELGMANNYDANPEDLRKKKQRQDEMETMTDVFIDYFNKCDPSKPALGRELAKRLDVDSFPDNLQGIIEDSIEIAR